MFTTGSKLFLGATVLSIVGRRGLRNAEGWRRGLARRASVCSSPPFAFAFLFGVNYYTRDGNVSAMSENATTRSSGRAAACRAQHVAGARRHRRRWHRRRRRVEADRVQGRRRADAGRRRSSGWCSAGASEPRPTPAYNASLRKRMLHPIEFPVLAAVGLGAVIYSFSRIMLWIDKSAGPVVFVVAGALVLFGGFLFASKPSLKKGVVTGVCAIGALGLISAGAVMALDGQRTIEEHPTTETDNGAACLAGGRPGRAGRGRRQGLAGRGRRRPASA